MSGALWIEAGDSGLRLSELLDRVAAGRVVVITNDGKTVAVLTAYSPGPPGDESAPSFMAPRGRRALAAKLQELSERLAADHGPLADTTAAIRDMRQAE